MLACRKLIDSFVNRMSEKRVKWHIFRANRQITITYKTKKKQMCCPLNEWNLTQTDHHTTAFNFCSSIFEIPAAAPMPRRWIYWKGIDEYRPWFHKQCYSRWFSEHQHFKLGQRRHESHRWISKTIGMASERWNHVCMWFVWTGPLFHLNFDVLLHHSAALIVLQPQQRVDLSWSRSFFSPTGQGRCALATSCWVRPRWHTHSYDWLTARSPTAKLICASAEN